jgi:hypothetical protein
MRCFAVPRTRYDSHEALRNIPLAIGKGGGGADASANKSESRLGNCGIRTKMIRPRGWRSLQSNELSEDCRCSWMKQGAAIRCGAVRMLQIGNGKYVAGNKSWMSDR